MRLRDWRAQRWGKSVTPAHFNLQELFDDALCAVALDRQHGKHHGARKQRAIAKRKQGRVKQGIRQKGRKPFGVGYA